MSWAALFYTTHKLHKLYYIKLHLLLVFAKCTLMATHSYQIEMCSLRLIYIILMEIQSKINEAVKQRNIFFMQSLMLPNIIRTKYRQTSRRQNLNLYLVSTDLHNAKGQLCSHWLYK